MQSPVVREHARISEDQVIMKAVALGWPDDGFPANAVVSERKERRRSDFLFRYLKTKEQLTQHAIASLFKLVEEHQ